jgi:hypothetical protein
MGFDCELVLLIPLKNGLPIVALETSVGFNRQPWLTARHPKEAFLARHDGL